MYKSDSRDSFVDQTDLFTDLTHEYEFSTGCHMTSENKNTTEVVYTILVVYFTSSKVI